MDNSMNTNQKNFDQKKGGLSDKIGEAVEKVGTAVGNVAPGLGKKIHDAGDRMEKTHKNPNHPTDENV